MIHEQTKQYEWDAIEHEHSKKSVDWFWALGIIILTGIILSVISKNYLLAILLGLGGVLIGWRANDDDDLVHVEISERGIKLNKDLYTHDTIKSFWMYVDHHDRNRLVIVTSRAVMPQRILTLPESIKATDLREFLVDYIEERETRPSAIDLLAEAVGL